jgi:predicted Zn-dependent protease
VKTVPKGLRNSHSVLELPSFRRKQYWLISFSLALALCGISGCEKSATMSVTTDNPPRIMLSGDTPFDWLEVRGPLPEKLDDQGPSIIWKIVPEDTPPPLSDVPPIVYKEVPKGFRQAEPKTGVAPDLTEGGIYSITVVTRGPNNPRQTIIIRNGKAEEFHPEDRKVDTSGVSSYIPRKVDKPAGAGRIHFVPLSYPPAILAQLKDYYKQKYDLAIDVEPELRTDFSKTYDVQTGQHVAEMLVRALKEKYPDRGNDVYIGFIPQDMYIKGQTARFAYNFIDGGYGVVSDARLAVFADEDVQKARLRKVVSRTVGILYYNLPPSEDNRSVLYKGLRGPDDLDRMSEDF